MISIVIPCFNEEAVLAQMASRLSAAADLWNEPWEVICVDDGSRDSTWEKLLTIAKNDDRWKLVRFARNFGHQKAVSAGLAHATGDAVFVIDADLQDPPEELHRFLEKWREGYEVVYAIRRKRKEAWFKRLCYYLFYRGLSLLSQTSIPLDSGDFCLMDQKVVAVLRQMPEQNRFIRGMRAWVGFRQIGIEYARHARAAGVPQYTFKKLLQLAADGVLSFSTIPLRIATYLGLAVSTAAFFGIGFVLLQRLMAGWFESIGFAPAPGFATIVISVLFMGGVQLVCVGIIGEYIGRIYDEVKHRPLWIESDTYGFHSGALNINDSAPVQSIPIHNSPIRKAS
jgi:polyisoprenyl-phosphate glycosyltransferase